MVSTQKARTIAVKYYIARNSREIAMPLIAGLPLIPTRTEGNPTSQGSKIARRERRYGLSQTTIRSPSFGAQEDPQ
jgi:hypothetical protein